MLTMLLRGVPYWCVGITASFCLLAFMSVSTASNKVFFWFYSLTAVSGLITWISVCVAYIKFYGALAAQGIDRSSSDFPLKSPWQPYLAWFSLIFFTTVILVNGFAVFIHGYWNTSSFLVAYIGIP
jgi:amino acid transporter